MLYIFYCCVGNSNQKAKAEIKNKKGKKKDIKRDTKKDRSITEDLNFESWKLKNSHKIGCQGDKKDQITI